MIGRLRGVVEDKQAPFLLLDVNGVGYELQAPMTTFFQLPEDGAEVLLHTHFAVSETAQQLFGFISQRDRELFRLLIKVSGVGPKMAVSIMSMEADDFVRCVLDDNVKALVKVPGVGKKTAERLIIETRDKLKSWSVAPSAAAPSIPSPAALSPVESAPTVDSVADAESALIALGYKPAEAARAVSVAAKTLDADAGDASKRSETLIRAALRSMLPS